METLRPLYQTHLELVTQRLLMYCNQHLFTHPGEAKPRETLIGVNGGSLSYTIIITGYDTIYHYKSMLEKFIPKREDTK